MAWKDVLDTYAGFLITQYRAKPKAQMTVKLLTNSAVCDGLPLQLQTCFDLATASGNQLTILGKIIGVPRNIVGLDLIHTFYNTTRYSGTPASIGFLRYNSSSKTTLIMRYVNNASYTLSDLELRALIYLRIISNTKPRTTKAIKEGLWQYFGSDISVATLANMSATFTVAHKYTNPFLVAIFLGIVPVPMGVSVTASYV
jgi:hypothetical protein